MMFILERFEMSRVFRDNNRIYCTSGAHVFTLKYNSVMMAAEIDGKINDYSTS